MFEDFETSLNEYFNNMTNTYLEKLLKENEEYTKLTTDMHRFLEDLIEKIPEFEGILDNFLDTFYQITGIENTYLYKKGYCDCLKLLKYLENS